MQSQGDFSAPSNSFDDTSEANIMDLQIHWLQRAHALVFRQVHQCVTENPSGASRFFNDGEPQDLAATCYGSLQFLYLIMFRGRVCPWRAERQPQI